MQHGNATDYQGSFLDRNAETTDEAVARVVSIGLGPLRAWWERVKHDTSPGTYGATPHDFAGSVAYLAAGGPVARHVVGRSPEEIDASPEHVAARQLRAEINWT